MIKSRICPWCNKRISFKKTLEYFYYDSSHITECDKCKNKIKPIKDPVNGTLSFYLGFCSIIIPGSIFMFLYNKDFITSVLLSSLFFCVTEFFIILITLKKLYFTKT